MNWFKKLFGIGDKMETDIHGLPYVKSIVPMPKVKPCKVDKPTPEKNISEPTYAIVEAMRKYPSRFKAKAEYKLSESTRTNVYKVVDIKTNQSLFGSRWASISFAGGGVSWNYNLSWKWLTPDEAILLVEEFKKIQDIKLKRKDSLARAKVRSFYQ